MINNHHAKHGLFQSLLRIKIYRNYRNSEIAKIMGVFQSLLRIKIYRNQVIESAPFNPC